MVRFLCKLLYVGLVLLSSLMNKTRIFVFLYNEWEIDINEQ